MERPSFSVPTAALITSLVKEESVKRIKVEEGKVHFNDKLVFDVTPMLENEELCGVIYSHEEIEKAVFHAVRIMNERVQENLGLSFNEAGMLLSAVGDLRFCQVVDPERTVMMCVPKKIMKGLF